ncbi:DUF86 domain-containing protein [Rathayibacter sp. Leaf296]|uniref:HepT-like ribonuclease domain-containing protein n=1 Tax=Rathayibacter sp. Leaf296 TaxID=1736327 RepID=UPI000702461F|nr:HepT-like ribonuclease domain-containing protein [Rathayibacter sp. Leaf296]KQQ10844.1 hypothetical protein ASF46_07575 [Rathayibacter sp. Leaf296]
MSRSAEERFSDILAAIDRCLEYREHLGGGDAVLARMALDAVLRNLAVIGEAVRALPTEARDGFVAVPWAAIAGLRNVIVHEYFRIQPELIIGILDDELIPLADALRAHRR